MTIRRGLHVADSDGEGADALEARLALAGLFSSFGVLDGMAVTGRASWAYNVATGKVASSRGAADGAVLFANDSTAIVGTDGEGDTIPPAPGTGSRIDIIYALHRDVDNGDADSLPVFGVASGVASGSPVAPAIPAGAVELARATLAAGATNTAHANVTISHANTPRALLRIAPAEDVSQTLPTGAQAGSAQLGSIMTLAAAPYARRVEFWVTVNCSTVTAGARFYVVLTSNGGSVLSNVIRRVLIPYNPTSAMGSSVSFSGWFDLPANTSIGPRVWVEREAGGPVTITTGSVAQLSVRAT